MTENNNNTEKEILDAAERLFLKKGFALTSTTEIAKEVGCNQALVHYYYRTKEKLFTGIFEKKTLLFLSDFISGSRKDLPFEEKIKGLIEAHFNMLLKNQQLPFFLFTELILNEKRLDVLKKNLSDNYGEVYRKFDDELKSEIAKGNIRQMTFMDILFTIVSLNGMVFMINPIIKKTLICDENEYREFIDKRRNENIRIVMLSIKP
ncbi:MAG TPA: TetR/AcrR family transcriptional regulator [Bacteroidales bacterium]|nr:TetR/AcrR family transcriptional regulator [Bacteroidales bacterium]